MSKPLVSVLMLTYNHEKFIAEALESVLMQETNFPFEVVIGDDLSSDKTRKILLQYKSKYPDTFVLLFNTKNVKPTANLLNVYSKCRGTFIALLEGDDYWTAADKLQKQVDFLNQNPDCSICFHATSMINRDGIEVLELPLRKFRKARNTLDDLVHSESFMATCSTMFRNNLFTSFPAWLRTLTYIGDLPLNILNAKYGSIGYIDEVMSVYRWSSSDLAFSAQPSLIVNIEGIKMFLGILKEVDSKYLFVILDKISRNCFDIAEVLLQQKKLSAASYFYSFYVRHRKSHDYISLQRRAYLSLLFTVKRLEYNLHLNFAPL